MRKVAGRQALSQTPAERLLFGSYSLALSTPAFDEGAAATEGSPAVVKRSISAPSQRPPEATLGAADQGIALEPFVRKLGIIEGEMQAAAFFPAEG